MLTATRHAVHARSCYCTRFYTAANQTVAHSFAHTQLLALPLPAHSPGMAAEHVLLRSLSRVQRWRAALWSAVHGEPWAARPLRALDLDLLTWTWRRLDKAIGALVDAGAHATTATHQTVPPGTQRLSHVCGSMREALGLESAPDKPLAWRHAGRPGLPRSMALLDAALRLRRLARAMGVGKAGPAAVGGGLDDVAAAGVPIHELLQVRQKHLLKGSL